MASAAVESNNKQSDSSLTSKSARPHVPVDLVPLNDPLNEKQSEVRVKCSHFSIRGYVSEVRKRNPGVCYPFSLKDSVNPLYTELPDMEVRKFRWWRCISCVPEASVSCGAGNEEAEKTTDKNTDTSLDPAGKILKVNLPKERNGEASTSSDSNDNRNGHKTVFADPKGKGKGHNFFDAKGKGKAHVDAEPAMPPACDNGFLKNPTQVSLQQTTDRFKLSQTAGNQVIEVEPKRHENGTNKAFQRDSREYQIKTGLAMESVNHNREYATENCQKKSQDILNNRLADSPTNIITAEKVELVNGSRNDCKSRLLDLPDLNECSGEPLCDEKNKAVINSSKNNGVNCDVDDDDDYLGAECRKNPKVRLLSELLGLKETQISARGRKKKRSLASSVDENVKRKRVGSQEEGSKSMENKNLTRISESSVSDSEYTSDTDDISTEIISKTPVKRQCKTRISLPEKRNKKTKIDQGGTSLYGQNVINKSAAPEKGKTSENLPPKNDVTDKLIKRSLVMTKKRGKICKEKNSLYPCKSRVPKDVASTQRYENAEKIFAQKLQKGSESDINSPRNLLDRLACVSADQDISNPPSEAELMLIDGDSTMNRQESRNNGGDTGVAFRITAVGTPTVDLYDGNGECCIYPKTTMKDKKAGIPEAEASSSLAQDTHVQKEQIKEVRRRIHDIDINSIPIDDKATDDIPMDIVELMAKNQYERHLSDPKSKPSYLATPDISGKYIRDNGNNGSYGEYWPNFRQSPFLNMPRPPSNTDPRNSMAHSNLGYLSDFNRNSLSVASCHPRENPVSAKCFFPHQEEHNSSYPPYDLTLNSWNGNINMAAPQRYPPRFIHAAESYRLQACAPRQNTNEASHVWPSVVANRIPLRTNKLQMIPQNPSVLTKGKFGHHQTSGSILTFNTPGPTSFGKQKNFNFSKGCSNVGGHLESSGGSVEYSNDAVSAMHLLSLMQNAARTQNTTELSLGPRQNVVRPMSSRQSFMEEKCSSTFMQENARHPCYPTAIPTARPFALSFQSNGENIGRTSNNSGFVGPSPLTLRGQRNMESPHFGLPGGDQHPQRQHMGSSLEKGKDSSVISRLPYVSPLQGMKGTTSNLFARGVRRDVRNISPTPEKMICKLNQNPSEFNDLKELSRYMIGPDDLRPRRKARQKSVRPRGDLKRQEVKLNKHSLPDIEREKQSKF